MNAKVEPLVSPLPMQAASQDIWHTKYQLKTKTGAAVDTDIDGTYERVARALSQVEAEAKRDSVYQDFKWALKHGVIPAGRIMSNAGAGEHKPATSTIN
jgi:ribonucleoside-diphosphate reductase alpha chain